MLNAASLQYGHAAVHRVPLADATQADAYAWQREAHASRVAVQDHMAVVDARQGPGDLAFIRALVLAEVIKVADAGIGDVEGAFCNARVLQGVGQQIE